MQKVHEPKLQDIKICKIYQDIENNINCFLTKKTASLYPMISGNFSEFFSSADDVHRLSWRQSKWWLHFKSAAGRVIAKKGEIIQYQIYNQYLNNILYNSTIIILNIEQQWNIYIYTVSASALADYDGARRLRLMESEILSEGNQKFWFQDAVLQNVCSKVWMLLFFIPPWRLEHILWKWHVGICVSDSQEKNIGTFLFIWHQNSWFGIIVSDRGSFVCFLNRNQNLWFEISVFGIKMSGLEKV